MPARDVKLGITRHEGALIDSVETDDSLQVKELVGSDGEIARVNTLQLIAALTALGILLDEECPYLETRGLIEPRERRLVIWTLKAQSECGRFNTRKMIVARHDLHWTTRNAEHPFA